MKMYKGCAAALALMLTLGGCTLPGSDDGNHGNGQMADSYSYTQEDSGSSEELAYSWLIEPTITADNMIVFDGSVVDPDHENNKAYAEYAVIRVGGKYGLIDYKANVVVEPEYDDYYTCWCGEIVLFNVVDAKEEEYEYCTIDSTGTIAFSAPDHESDAPEYFWDENKGKVFVKKKNEEYASEYTGKKAVAVKECTATKTDWGYDIDVENGAFCGLAKKGELLTGIEYVDYYAPAYKGAGATLIAFKDTQGMWGYLDSDGNTVIDFKCDGDMNAFNGIIMDDMTKSHPYLFNGDYVPVSVGGAYGYYDKEGNVVVHPGDFGQARPVHNGRAWVRVGNYWGVIKLGEIVEAAPKELETTTSTTTTTSRSSTSTTTTTTSETTTTTSGVTTLSETTSLEPVVTTDATDITADTEPEVTEPIETEPVVTEPVVTEPVPTDTQPAEDTPAL